MKALLLALGLAWLGLHLSGYGVLVWRTDFAAGKVCHYLHSTGIFESSQGWPSVPCSKLRDMNNVG